MDIECLLPGRWEPTRGQAAGSRILLDWPELVVTHMFLGVDWGLTSSHRTGLPDRLALCVWTPPCNVVVVVVVVVAVWCWCWAASGFARRVSWLAGWLASLCVCVCMVYRAIQLCSESLHSAT